MPARWIEKIVADRTGDAEQGLFHCYENSTLYEGAGCEILHLLFVLSPYFQNSFFVVYYYWCILNIT